MNDFPLEMYDRKICYRGRRKSKPAKLKALLRCVTMHSDVNIWVKECLVPKKNMNAYGFEFSMQLASNLSFSKILIQRWSPVHFFSCSRCKFCKLKNTRANGCERNYLFWCWWALATAWALGTSKGDKLTLCTRNNKSGKKAG